jgi:virulence factor Mce-like protein
LLGLGMILLVVAVLGTCIAVYNKAFTTQVPVTVHIAQVDNSFLPNAEVRFHDVAVGNVDRAEALGDQAVLYLALEPDKVAHIPKNVRAMILPKSLFGESFLSLQLDGAPAAERLAAGDDIPRDRSGKAIQIEQLFSHLLPLIQAVKPGDLANALGGLSMALTNRGAQLGDTATQLHQYLSKFNPALPDLTADIRALPPFTTTASQAAPDLIQALKTLNTTSGTLVDRRADFDDLYDTVTNASDDLKDFVDENGGRIIDLVRTARPTLELLERYSPEYVCLFKRLADAIPLGKPVFGEGTARPAIRVQVVITRGRGKYLPKQDEPEITDDRGPRCYNNTPPIEQYPGGPFEDGATHPPAAAPGSQLAPTTPFGPILPLSAPASAPAVSGPAAAGPPAPSLPMLGGTGAKAPAPPASSGPPILLRGVEGISR